LDYKLNAERIINNFSEEKLAAGVCENIVEHKRINLKMNSSGGNSGNEGNSGSGGNSGNSRPVYNRKIIEIQRMGDINHILYNLEARLDEQDDKLRVLSPKFDIVPSDILRQRNHTAETLNNCLLQYYNPNSGRPVKQFPILTQSDALRLRIEYLYSKGQLPQPQSQPQQPQSASRPYDPVREPQSQPQQPQSQPQPQQPQPASRSYDPVRDI